MNSYLTAQSIGLGQDESVQQVEVVNGTPPWVFYIGMCISITTLIVVLTRK